MNIEISIQERVVKDYGEVLYRDYYIVGRLDGSSWTSWLRGANCFATHDAAREAAKAERDRIMQVCADRPTEDYTVSWVPDRTPRSHDLNPHGHI